jgi:hypothetical protein
MAFSVPHFSADAYFTLRQIMHIQETGLPFFSDPLSFGGRALAFNPVFAYLLTAFSAVIGLYLTLKIVPQIFAVMLVPIMYFLAFQLTHKRSIAFTTAILAGFIPVFFANTINGASVYALVIPLMFLINFLLIKHRDARSFHKPFFLLALLLIIIHPSSWVWLLGFAFYFIICWLERIKVSMWSKEAFLSLAFFNLVWTLLWFHEPLRLHGVGVLWQNTPAVLRGLIYSNFNFFSVISLIGIVPLVAAAWTVYRQLSSQRNRNAIFLISQMLAAFLLLWFTFIPFIVGLMLFAASAVALFPFFLEDLFSYIRKTKFPSLVPLTWVVLIVLIAASTVVPAFVFGIAAQSETVSPASIDAGLYLSQTPKRSVIISFPEDGQWLLAVTNRTVFMDAHFLLAPAPAVRLKDVEAIYQAQLGVQVLEIIDDYGLESPFIYYDASKPDTYSDALTLFAGDSDCFVPVFNESGVILFEVTCGLVST